MSARIDKNQVKFKPALLKPRQPIPSSQSAPTFSASPQISKPLYSQPSTQLSFTQSTFTQDEDEPSWVTRVGSPPPPSRVPTLGGPTKVGSIALPGASGNMPAFLSVKPSNTIPGSSKVDPTSNTSTIVAKDPVKAKGEKKGSIRKTLLLNSSGQYRPDLPIDPALLQENVTSLDATGPIVEDHSSLKSQKKRKLLGADSEQGTMDVEENSTLKPPKRKRTNTGTSDVGTKWTKRTSHNNEGTKRRTRKQRGDRNEEEENDSERIADEDEQVSERGNKKPTAQRKIKKKGKGNEKTQDIDDDIRVETVLEDEELTEVKRRPKRELLTGDINPSTLMSQICEDTGQGRISKRFEELREKKQEEKERREKVRKRMKEKRRIRERGLAAFREGRDLPIDIEVAGEEEEEEEEEEGRVSISIAKADEILREAAEKAGDLEEEGEEEETIESSHYAPQLRIVNGQLVIDEESLQVDRSKDPKIAAKRTETVYENQGDAFVNSATWGKNKRTPKWNLADTALFYDGISMFGTDFEMIAKLFPDRTRAQIKNKWNKEERVNPNGLTEALKSRKKIDMDFYRKATGRKYATPPPVTGKEEIAPIAEGATGAEEEADADQTDEWFGMAGDETWQGEEEEEEEEEAIAETKDGGRTEEVEIQEQLGTTQTTAEEEENLPELSEVFD